MFDVYGRFRQLVQRFSHSSDKVYLIRRKDCNGFLMGRRTPVRRQKHHEGTFLVGFTSAHAGDELMERISTDVACKVVGTACVKISPGSLRQRGNTAFDLHAMDAHEFYALPFTKNLGIVVPDNNFSSKQITAMQQEDDSRIWYLPCLIVTPQTSPAIFKNHVRLDTAQ